MLTTVGFPLPNIGQPGSLALSPDCTIAGNESELAMKAGDEYCIRDPHNGDISGSVSGAPPRFETAPPPCAPGAVGALSGAPRLASPRPSPIFLRLDPTRLLLLSPSRFQKEERSAKQQGHAPWTKGRRTETGKVSSSRGDRNGDVVAVAEEDVTPSSLLK